MLCKVIDYKAKKIFITLNKVLLSTICKHLFLGKNQTIKIDIKMHHELFGGREELVRQNV